MPALVGQVVAVTVREFANEAMIAQEAKMPTESSGELLVGAAGAPEGAAEFLAQANIGDTREGAASCGRWAVVAFSSAGASMIKSVAHSLCHNVQ